MAGLQVWVLSARSPGDLGLSGSRGGGACVLCKVERAVAWRAWLVKCIYKRKGNVATMLGELEVIFCFLVEFGCGSCGVVLGRMEEQQTKPKDSSPSGTERGKLRRVWQLFSSSTSSSGRYVGSRSVACPPRSWQSLLAWSVKMKIVSLHAHDADDTAVCQDPAVRQQNWSVHAAADVVLSTWCGSPRVLE